MGWTDHGVHRMELYPVNLKKITYKSKMSMWRGTNAASMTLVLVHESSA